MGDYSVYCHTVPSGKRYIGIAGDSVQKRWNNGFGYKLNRRFFGDIAKYGWDNIKHEVLVDNLDKKQAEKIEMLLIGAYESSKPEKGYNTIDSEYYKTLRSISPLRQKKQIEGLRKAICKRVKQIKMVPNVDYLGYEYIDIATFDSITEAAKITGLHASAISQCCRDDGNGLYGRKIAGGYYWEYAE